MSLFIAQLAFSQTYQASDVKAALVAHFLKNLQWPNEPELSQLSIGVWKDQALLQSFSGLARQTIRDKSIRMLPINSVEQARGLQMLYVPEAYIPDITQLVVALRGKGVLIVSEESESLHNVMINVRMEQLKNNKANINFQINRPNIAYEKISISSELVLYGGTEIDVAEIYFQSERALQMLRQQNEETYQQYQKQQLTFERQQRDYQQLLLKLDELQYDLEQKQKSISESEATQSNLNAQIKGLDDQIKTLDSAYSQTLEQMDTKEKELQQAEASLSQYQQEVQSNIERLASLKQQVEDNATLLTSQKQQLNQAETAVRKQSQVIDQQRSLLAIVLVIFTLGAGGAVIIGYLFIKNKRTTATLAKTLTELTSAKEQLVESEKMASLGQLVTGVAHEVNTPIGISLTAISTLGDNALSFKQKLTSGQLRKSEAIEFTESIEELDSLIQGNLQRCHTLVENFKQVSADQIVEECREICIQDYCLQIMQSLSAYLKQNAVEWQINGDNPTTYVDPGLLAQVINNLVTNAVTHAFEGVNDRQFAIDISALNDHILLVVKDNGVGMTEEVKANIFDPFFTTKRGRGGIGLGMNIVHTLVTTKLKGKIEVDSTQGKGTEFRLHIPNQGMDCC